MADFLIRSIETAFNGLSENQKQAVNCGLMVDHQRHCSPPNVWRHHEFNLKTRDNFNEALNFISGREV